MSSLFCHGSLAILRRVAIVFRQPHRTYSTREGCASDHVNPPRRNSRVPVDGGQECKVLDSVTFMNFDMTLGGIYFISGTELRCLNFGTRTSKLIRKILKPPDHGLAVSPDAHWLLLHSGRSNRR
jgi:hypothetical protein